jgi:SAM-dependent methyltransferase
MATRSYNEIWRDVYGDMQDVGPVHRHMRRMLAGILRDLDYRDALEVGCGAGHNLELLREGRSLRRLSGADISQEALGRARARLGDSAELVELDVVADPLPGTWDLVLCSLLLEHVADHERAVANLAAMTGRHLLLTTIAGDFERYRAWDEQVGHVRNYRRGELEAMVAAQGLRIARTIYWGAPFYSPLTRMAQNRAQASSSYGRMQRAASAVLGAVYHLNSSRRGDLLILLAER